MTNQTALMENDQTILAPTLAVEGTEKAGDMLTPEKNRDSNSVWKANE